MFYKTISLIFIYLLSIQIANSSPIQIIDNNICKSDEKSDENKNCEIKCISEVLDNSLFSSIISNSFFILGSQFNSRYFLKTKIEIEPKSNSPPSSFLIKLN